MEMATTTLVNSLDLINLSKDLAQLNLGYLGISVAILGGLGAVFVYFNIRPFQERLTNQEQVIDELKKEAKALLDKAEIQTQESLKEFEERQVRLFATSFDQQKENLYLEVTNKIQSAENDILEKSNSSSSDKDSKVKEILLSEMNNKILSLEKSLTTVFEKYKTASEEKLSSFQQRTLDSIKEIESDVLELKAHKYDMEGKMGGIIFTIEAVEKCWENDPYLLKFKLADLKEKIGKYHLTPELFIRLKEILKKIESKNDEHSIVIKEIKDSVKLQEKPEI